MKRLIAATIALTLLGSTAAMADDWDSHHSGRYEHNYNNDSGAAIAAGFGIAALAIIASQHHDHDGYYARDRYYRGYRHDRDRDNGYYNRSYYDRGYYDRSDYDRDGSYRHD